jgi:hypothetical protein
VWSITGKTVEDATDGYDGTWYKWLLERDGQHSFTVVKITRHARLNAADVMPPRATAAADTDGRSEVERHLTAARPPRVIEVGTSSEPVVTARRT